MEDVLGLRGPESHPPPAALVVAKSARDDRVTAGLRWIAANVLGHLVTRVTRHVREFSRIAGLKWVNGHVLTI
jgi:hypothetical protein